MDKTKIAKKIKKTDNSPEKVGEKKKKKEQERTTTNKELFLKFFEKSLGAVRTTCEEIRIDKSTFYGWMQDDAEFAEKIKQIKIHRVDDAEDRLLSGIRHGSIRAATYFLDRMHPDYKPTSKLEHIINPVGKTLKQLIDEDEAELNKPKNAGDNKQSKSKDESGADGKHSVDPKQARAGSAVPGKPSPKNILGKKDPKKPVAEAKAKGD